MARPGAAGVEPVPADHDLSADIIVVGAGASGAVAAARLSESCDRRVLLLESGEACSQGRTGQLLGDASSLQAAIDPLTSWTYPSELTSGRPWHLYRGRALGGSTAVNAGYFVRAAPSDLALWTSRLGWAPDRVLAAYRRAETDLDHPDHPDHGSSGPIQVERPPQDDPVTQALRRSAAALGLGDVADVNGRAPGPGFGALPRNVTAGRRWDTGRAYLWPARSRPNLQVVTGAHVVGLDVEVRAGRTPRTTGVTALVAGRAVECRAPEVVLCAGAIGSAHLLLLAGIGPARDLAGLGRRVVADLPVGRTISDHPQITVSWAPADPATHEDLLRSVIHAGDLELLPLLHPTDSLFGRAPRGDGRLLDLLVADQAPESRGQLELDPTAPAGPPLIRFRHLESHRDRETLRDGVRLAVSLLAGAGAQGPMVAGPSPEELDDDRSLDAWVRSRLGTAQHLTGSAPAGRPREEAAVVGPSGRVRGVDGLRVADLSVLPQVPCRGPAATAVMLGELLVAGDT